MFTELKASERIVGIETRSGRSEHDWTLASGATLRPRQVPPARMLLVTAAGLIAIGRLKKDDAALVATVPYSLRGSGHLVIQHRQGPL
jgi:hypothetical protein